ncbi:MAG: tripartite tricarboxylate transporter TctB family protein [Dehalococcoidia bacterium]|nr:tripartite tricarboxylate transporter TctB family protein [Dehalococcoidia bacterium]
MTTVVQGIMGASGAHDPSAASGYFYLGILGVGLAFCTLILAGSYLSKRRPSEGSPGEPREGPEPHDPDARGRFVTIVVLLFGYLVLFPLVGFAVDTILFCTLFFRFFGRNRWLTSTAFGIAAGASFYFVLVTIARVSLPHSLIGL